MRNGKLRPHADGKAATPQKPGSSTKHARDAAPGSSVSDEEVARRLHEQLNAAPAVVTRRRAPGGYGGYHSVEFAAGEAGHEAGSGRQQAARLTRRSAEQQQQQAADVANRPRELSPTASEDGEVRSGRSDKRGWPSGSSPEQLPQHKRARRASSDRRRSAVKHEGEASGEAGAQHAGIQQRLPHLQDADDTKSETGAVAGQHRSQQVSRELRALLGLTSGRTAGGEFTGAAVDRAAPGGTSAAGSAGRSELDVKREDGAAASHSGGSSGREGVAEDGRAAREHTQQRVHEHRQVAQGWPAALRNGKKAPGDAKGPEASCRSGKAASPPPSHSNESAGTSGEDEEADVRAGRGGAAAPHTPARLAKIPKLPMVRHKQRWYRARLLKDTQNCVLIEFAGFEAETGQVWLPKESERIWRGSYKGKDWRYLGEGAWEPKKKSKKRSLKALAAAGASKARGTLKPKRSGGEPAGSAAASGAEAEASGELPETPTVEKRPRSPVRTSDDDEAQQDTEASADDDAPISSQPVTPRKPGASSSAAAAAAGAAAASLQLDEADPPAAPASAPEPISAPVGPPAAGPDPAAPPEQSPAKEEAAATAAAPGPASQQGRTTRGSRSRPAKQEPPPKQEPDAAALPCTSTAAPAAASASAIVQPCAASEQPAVAPVAEEQRKPTPAQSVAEALAAGVSLRVRVSRKGRPVKAGEAGAPLRPAHGPPPPPRKPEAAVATRRAEVAVESEAAALDGMRSEPEDEDALRCREALPTEDGAVKSDEDHEAPSASAHALKPEGRLGWKGAWKKSFKQQSSEAHGSDGATAAAACTVATEQAAEPPPQRQSQRNRQRPVRQDDYDNGEGGQAGDEEGGPLTPTSRRGQARALRGATGRTRWAGRHQLIAAAAAAAALPAPQPSKGNGVTAARGRPSNGRPRGLTVANGGAGGPALSRGGSGASNSGSVGPRSSAAGCHRLSAFSSLLDALSRTMEGRVVKRQAAVRLEPLQAAVTAHHTHSYSGASSPVCVKSVSMGQAASRWFQAHPHSPRILALRPELFSAHSSPDSAWDLSPDNSASFSTAAAPALRLARPPVPLFH